MENTQQSPNGSNFNDYNDVNLTIRILFHGRVSIKTKFISFNNLKIIYLSHKHIYYSIVLSRIGTHYHFLGFNLNVIVLDTYSYLIF